MKRWIIILLSAILPFAARAEDEAQPGINAILAILGIAGEKIVGGPGMGFIREITIGDPISIVVGSFLGLALGFIGLILLIFLIYGGYLWMTAGGEDEQIEDAKKIITRAIVGLLIVVGAYVLSFFILWTMSEITTQRVPNPDIE